MKHLGTVYMETDRLILRRCQESDYMESFTYCCSDPELARLQSFDVHTNPDTTRRSFIEKEKQYEKDDTFMEWAIIKKETNEFMGEIALVNLNDKDESVELGYHLGKKFRGNGYMTEAIAAIQAFAFDQLQCQLLYASILADNFSSQKSITNNGFKYSYTNQEYKDEVYEGPMPIYAMTREEYKKYRNGTSIML